MFNLASKKFFLEQGKVYPYATGGDYVYLYEDTETGKTYRVHEFLTAGATATLKVEVGGQMEILVVGGGGGGGSFPDHASGGGGAGLFIEKTENVDEGSYSVVVGAGGPADSSGGLFTNTNTDGSTSSFSGNSISLEADGGGGGGEGFYGTQGRTGGSGGGGGGGGASQPETGGASTATEPYEYGNAGGNGLDGGGGNSRAGGGGGAGSAGENATSTNSGNGGSGREWLNGKIYAAGGGGSAGRSAGVNGDGGSGIGGDGGTDWSRPATSGKANTGSGGGGSKSTAAGAGGSGIVIVRYVIAEKTLWTPSELTSLKAWYKADSLSLSDGDPVSTWNDDSGNGYSLTGTGTGRPLFQTNTINGLPVIEFDGTDDFLQASTASDWSFMHSGAAGNSFFAVALSNYTTTTARGSLAWTSPFSSVKRGWTWAHEGGGGSGQRNYILVLTGTVSTYVARNKAGFGSLPPSVPIISSQIGDPTNATISERSSIRIDGGTAVEANTDTATPSSLDPNSPLTLGKSGDSGMAWLDGWFGELIFYDTKLNDTDRQKIEGYLAHKWGLTDNLPSGHPYKYEPPYKVEPEEIVTDGLVLNLDAGDYASYPRSGTTWYDISGNGYNGTLTNGPTYDSANKGSIVFDGSDDIFIGPSSNSIIGDSQTTITNILIFKTTNTTQRMYASSLKRTSAASTLLSIDINTDNTSSFSSGRVGFLTSNGAGHSWITYNGGVNDGNWHFVACVVDTNGRRLYLDGSLVASDSVTLTTASGNTGTYTVGGFDTSNTLFDGSIALSLIYTRSLSTEEIQQNFNALKGRYGL